MRARFALPTLALFAGCSRGESSHLEDGGGAVDGAGLVDTGAFVDTDGFIDAGVSSGGPLDAAASSSSSGGDEAGNAAGSGGPVVYGHPYAGGQFHLGPVDYPETQWHNACAPGTKYAPQVQQVEGTLLAGLWNGIPNIAGYCDACIWMVTDKGKSAMLRVVTYGQTTTNSVDTSPDAYQSLNSGEYPRSMTWQFAKCPDNGPVLYEFQTGSSQYWTSLWVRNARVPLTTVEVRSTNHTAWTALQRGSDGTLTDASGFGAGTFSIRSTGLDGQQVIDTFAWPGAGIAGAFLTGTANFH